jgi:TolB protein
MAAVIFGGTPHPSARADASDPPRHQVEAWQRAYMAALNAHDVEAVLRFYAKDVVRRRHGEVVGGTRESLRAIREWEAPMRTRFDYETVTVRGEWLTARLLETNALYDALDVQRPMVSQYRWRNGGIVETNLAEIREAGRTWQEALPDLEAWLARRPASETAGAIRDGRLVFTASGGRALAPLLAEYRKETDAARQQNEAVMRSFIAAMNRHDVDTQYAHYGAGMHFIDDGRRVVPERNEERLDRQFEAANRARWSYKILGAGIDSLEMIVSERMDFYDLLGVGTRRHRARYRFRGGKIVEGRTWEWTQEGRPYRGARDGFAAWALKERPDAAARFTRNGGLVFDGTTPALMNPLVREWRAARPCRLYHPSFNASGTQIAFSSDCEGPWGIYVMQADGSLPRRVTPLDMEARLPNWSPDAAKLVFQSNRGGNWNIYTVDADGSNLQRMTDHPAGDSSGAFSPDGTRILFASDREGGLNDLFVMPAAGGEASRITTGAGSGFRSVWSPDGAHILYRASTPATAEQSVPGQFFRVRPDGASAGTIAGGPRHEYNQAYSPDGSLIAFDAHRKGGWESEDGGWEVWVMNADGTGRRMLTRNDVNDWGPSWSPDGRTILFLSGRNNVYDVYAMDANGSNVRRLTKWTR